MWIAQIARAGDEESVLARLVESGRALFGPAEVALAVDRPAAGERESLLAVRIGETTGAAAAAAGWLILDRGADAPFSDEERATADALCATAAAALGCAAASREARAVRAVLDTVIDQIPAVTYHRRIDGPGRPWFVSRQVEAMLGYSPREVEQDPDAWRDRLHPDDREAVMARQARFDPFAHGTVSDEYRLLARDGREVWVKNTAMAVRDDHGNPVAVLGLLFDVTDRRRALEARTSAEAQLGALIEAGLFGYMVADIDGAIHDSNETLARMLGTSREELRRCGWPCFAHPDNRARDQHAIDQLRDRDAVGPVVTEAVTRDGRRLPLLICASRVADTDRYACLVLDQSEQKNLESQLRQAQKVEAIGILAGGVAHDFNNILSVILSYASMLQEELAVEDPRREDLLEIARASERGSILTRQLLAFSRQQVLEPRELDLGQVLTGLEKMLRRLIGEDIELVTRVAPGLPAVLADAGQMEQVILNLAVNARDAMPRGGRLTLDASPVDLVGSAAARRGLAAGRHVRITVQDTGCGMSSAVLARVFEPFFTTKDRGHGTGLGLSTAFGIVQQSGGHIEVDSEPGRGSTFLIHLPASSAATAATPAGAVAAQIGPAVGAGEVVLVAEDDRHVRHLLREMLGRAGYTVMEARHGQEALEICSGGEPIDLLLTDVVMPHLSGGALIEQVRRFRPDLEILCMTGYPDDAMLRHGMSEHRVELVHKPIERTALLARLRALLDRRAA